MILLCASIDIFPLLLLLRRFIFSADLVPSNYQENHSAIKYHIPVIIVVIIIINIIMTIIVISKFPTSLFPASRGR